MTLQVKRILTLFSVALNIGFLISAILLYMSHPTLHQRAYRVHAKKALESLNLPKDQEQTVTAAMERFEDSIDQIHLSFHQARSKMLSALAQPGPLDKNQFDAASEEVKQLLFRKDNRIRTHILEMRRRLGDEKGAQFFTAMLAQVKPSK